jgi:hypothetical protein
MSEQTTPERASIPRAHLRTTDHALEVRKQILRGLCTIKELAAALDVSWRTIYLYMDQGLPWTQLGAVRYFNLQNVNAWLVSREHDRSRRPIGRPKKSVNKSKQK